MSWHQYATSMQNVMPNIKWTTKYLEHPETKLCLIFVFCSLLIVIYNTIVFHIDLWYITYIASLCIYIYRIFSSIYWKYFFLSVFFVHFDSDVEKWHLRIVRYIKKMQKIIWPNVANFKELLYPVTVDSTQLCFSAQKWYPRVHLTRPGMSLRYRTTGVTATRI